MSTLYKTIPADVVSSREFIRCDDMLAAVPYYTTPGLQNLSSFSWQNNDLRAMPFILGGDRSKKIIEIGVNITSAAVVGAKARLGIYADSGNVIPKGLLLDAGEVSISSGGFKSIVNLDAVLEPGLYWLVMWLYIPTGSVGTSVLTPATGLVNLLGYDVVALAGYSHYFVNSAYSNFPDSFPACALSRGGHPAIFIKFGGLS